MGFLPSVAISILKYKSQRTFRSSDGFRHRRRWNSLKGDMALRLSRTYPVFCLFEICAQAPLRLISWCSFELDTRSKALLRDLAVRCESATTSTKQLVDKIAQRQANVHSEQEAIEVPGHTSHRPNRVQSTNAQLPTMVQHFLGTLHLPMAIYMLDYYLPMLSLNDGYNETGLTMQGAGPVRQEWQSVQLVLTSIREANLANWKVTGGQDAFAFRHPSLTQTDVRELLDSEAHHHKVCPVGTGRLIAMVGITPTDDPSTRMLQVLFGLVLTITPRLFSGGLCFGFYDLPRCMWPPVSM